MTYKVFGGTLNLNERNPCHLYLYVYEYFILFLFQCMCQVGCSRISSVKLLKVERHFTF